MEHSSSYTYRFQVYRSPTPSPIVPHVVCSGLMVFLQMTCAVVIVWRFSGHWYSTLAAGKNCEHPVFILHVSKRTYARVFWTSTQLSHLRVKNLHIRAPRTSCMSGAAADEALANTYRISDIQSERTFLSAVLPTACTSAAYIFSQVFRDDCKSQLGLT